MEAVLADNKKEQKRFLDFRKKLYKDRGIFVDNSYFMIKEVFAGKTSFIRNKKIYPLNIVRDGEILCQGIVVYARDLPEYIQICFFEGLENNEQAVSLLIDKAVRFGRENKCGRLVAGLNGHVNYGLGFLNSRYGEINSFSAAANPEFYNFYFRDAGFDVIKLNSYFIEAVDERLDRYKGVIEKLNRNYEFRRFDKKKFDYYSRIYTDLNNQAFEGHRYYFKRNYEEDSEMLKELFLFMKEDSLIFAFDGDRPVAFIMWYPDFNELAKGGEIFGAKHFFRNILYNKKVRAAKIMEYGVLEEYRKAGLPMGLIHHVFLSLKNYGTDRVETSWILDENKDSNSFCQALCDREYKEYAVYEKAL